MKKHFHVVLACVGAISLGLSGCTSYRPDPPDLQQDLETWKQISLSVIPQGRTVAHPWPRLSIVGLTLNPDLNKARLKHLSSKHAARYAGLWEDPSLSLGGNRYIPGVMYDRSAALGLSLPVSGRTELARKVAECYAEADLHELQARELDYLTRLRALCFVIQITHTKHALMRHRLDTAQQETQSISQLHEMGEASAADLHAATQRCNDMLKELQELESAHLDRHLELVNMLGLHPAVGQLEVAGTLPAGVPPIVPRPTEQALLAHPRIKAAMSAFHTTEAELQLEIRKQYPDLSLSPGYSREEGNDKLTLEVGFTLPLWNRNREGIARSQGARALSRQSAIAQYRELVQQAYALSRRQELVRKHCSAEYSRLVELQAAANRQEQLYSLGELDLPTLATTRHETYTRRLAYLDCLAELLEIQVALKSLATANLL